MSSIKQYDVTITFSISTYSSIAPFGITNLLTEKVQNSLEDITCPERIISSDIICSITRIGN